MTSSLNNYEQKLLDGWESVHRKGQLTLWILLSLKDGPKHMQQIKEFVETRSGHTVTADDKSMYRALRRFKDIDLISDKSVPNAGGPDLKMYSLTADAENVLISFIKRNIQDIFLSDVNRDLFR